MKNITVIGSGTMGNGIAHVFAQNNYSVSLVDVNPAALEKALANISKNFDRQIAKGNVSEDQKAQALANITTFTSMAEGIKDAELAIEAATENENIKLKIFKEMDDLAPAGCLLASNTSSISITKLAAKTKRPGKVIGMHFMNPVPMMKLVEVINGFTTDEEVTKTIIETAENIGKITALSMDYPGFIANRLLMPMINEAIHTLHEGVGGVEDIDNIMKLGMAHPMGPLQLADFIGLDVCHSIMTVLYRGFGNPKYVPCPLLTNMVASKSLGKKTGEGFYNYTHGGKDLVVSSRFK
ncbi:MAG: 3-hydroxybutyryl-CoA dehydrogenase [Flavobacteriales bacterium]|nr:3-hydroxybutyryl-CoA dehydrogenase [Flavobacteriales bacterium]